MSFYENYFSWCSDSERCGKVECFRHKSNLSQLEPYTFNQAAFMGTVDCPYFEEGKDEEDEEEKYVITPWGCLVGTLLDYGVDVSHFTGRVGEHIVEDFMEAMEKAGYITKSEEE